jgi:hypothetical protein
LLTNLAGNGEEVIWNLPSGSAVNVHGRAGGNETFAVQNLPSNVVAPTINAGGSNNTLDYSAYTGDVTVNLRLHTATALAGISGIQNVIGSIGNDLLVGDGNANMLTGGTGRNIIIGGGGAATLIGGAGDNILIAGTTDYDADVTGVALNALMAEWTRIGLNADFATRVQNLTNGVGPSGQYKLTAQTVHRASAPNTLVGGGQNNWFFLALGVDLFSNSQNGDAFTYL